MQVTEDPPALPPNDSSFFCTTCGSFEELNNYDNTQVRCLSKHHGTSFSLDFDNILDNMRGEHAKCYMILFPNRKIYERLSLADRFFAIVLIGFSDGVAFRPLCDVCGNHDYKWHKNCHKQQHTPGLKSQQSVENI